MKIIFTNSNKTLTFDRNCGHPLKHAPQRMKRGANNDEFILSCVLILQREVSLHYNSIYHKTLNYIILLLSVKVERDL